MLSFRAWRPALVTFGPGRNQTAVALVFIAGVAVSSMAEDRLSKGIGIVREACADDVWRLCSDRLPGGGRIQDCIQDKMGQLSKGCVDALVDANGGPVIHGP